MLAMEACTKQPNPFLTDFFSGGGLFRRQTYETTNERAARSGSGYGRTTTRTICATTCRAVLAKMDCCLLHPLAVTHPKDVVWPSRNPLRVPPAIPAKLVETQLMFAVRSLIQQKSKFSCLTGSSLRSILTIDYGHWRRTGNRRWRRSILLWWINYIVWYNENELHWLHSQEMN